MDDIKKFILMCRDVKVAELPIGNNAEWIIFEKKLLPRNLVTNPKARASGIFGADTPLSKLITWCACRVLSIDRAYAKKVLNALSLSQAQDERTKAEIAIAFRCVSLCDSYWFRYSDVDGAMWRDINLRSNSLSKAIALIALSGSSMTLTVRNIAYTAEITTLGSYAKGWFRDDTGQLWLYKTKGFEGDEVEREICASNVIDCFNVFGNLKYEAAKMEGVSCSRCKLMSDEDKSVVHAADMDVWCMQNGTNVFNWTKNYFQKEYAQMIAIDYLIANSDRYMWNWGFFQDVQTGDITGLHPLYDHNNAFDVQLLNDEGIHSIVEQGKTMKEAAQFWVKRSGLKLLKQPKQSMFPNKLSFDVFVERCKQLGLWEMGSTATA